MLKTTIALLHMVLQYTFDVLCMVAGRAMAKCRGRWTWMVKNLSLSWGRPSLRDNQFDRTSFAGSVATLLCHVLFGGDTVISYCFVFGENFPLLCAFVPAALTNFLVTLDYSECCRTWLPIFIAPYFLRLCGGRGGSPRVR